LLEDDIDESDIVEVEEGEAGELERKKRRKTKIHHELPGIALGYANTIMQWSYTFADIHRFTWNLKHPLMIFPIRAPYNSEMADFLQKDSKFFKCIFLSALF
jgi:hypothetical protein